MKIKITYTKVVTEEFEVPNELIKMSGGYLLCNGELISDRRELEDLEKILDFIAERNPEIKNNEFWEPAGQICSIEIPTEVYERSDLYRRFGGKW